MQHALLRNQRNSQATHVEATVAVELDVIGLDGQVGDEGVDGGASGRVEAIDGAIVEGGNVENVAIHGEARRVVDRRHQCGRRLSRQIDLQDAVLARARRKLSETHTVGNDETVANQLSVRALSEDAVGGERRSGAIRRDAADPGDAPAEGVVLHDVESPLVIHGQASAEAAKHRGRLAGPGHAGRARCRGRRAALHARDRLAVEVDEEVAVVIDAQAVACVSR